MALTIDDFPVFFASVNEGHSPFPWQSRFLADVQDRLDDCGSVGPYFPELVDLPTGAGKTSLIDIAVFLLALEAKRPPEQRRIPRRIVFVVDRRVVVDQAHQHAVGLAAKLRAAEPESVVGRAATALRSYAPGGRDGRVPAEPLLATILRGGIVLDDTWARRPDLPAVISSTVDQVGSRLLFRGYGLSEAMQPIHAGLLGSDTLFLLDEVHLSEPFAQTMRGLADDYQVNWAERRVPAPWEVVELSATPGKQPTGRTFRLDAAHGDFDSELNETLPRRLRASKPVRVAKPVKVTGDDRTKIAATFAGACVKEAEALLEQQHVATVAVVVNRVETAVAVHRTLIVRGTNAVLLTGRMRPHDRDRLMRHKIGARLRTGRQRDDNNQSFVVVATQCIEAGADFDFDGLVTEAASLDALIQRFGRVDRDGRLSEAGTPAAGVVLVKSSDLKGEPDAVYGESLTKAWNALDAVASLDFGISGLPETLKADLELRVPPVNAPILFPGHLDAWVQTNPKPTPDPDPKFWLHGPGDAVGDVTIVWRSDLSEALLTAALGDAVGGDEDGIDLLAVRALAVAAPPGALESMSVPLAAARTWLSGQEVPAVSDVESASPDAEKDIMSGKARPFVRWQGDRTTVVLLPDSRRSAKTSALAGRPRSLREIRPGDVLMVPAAYGGLGEHQSWDPTSSAPVPDLAERTQLVQRRRAVLRLWPGVLRGVDGGPVPVVLPDCDDDPEVTTRARVRQWLDEHVDELCGEQRIAARQIHKALIRGGVQGRMVVVESLEATNAQGVVDHLVIVTGPIVDSPIEIARELDERTVGDVPGDSVDSEPDTGSFTAVEVALDAHLDGVGGWAKLLATNCGLNPGLAADLDLAGRLHDVGKADPRYQVWLNNGNPVTASSRSLAKSATAADAFALRRAARQRSGYPAGTRHELMSLAMIDGDGAVEAQAFDWDLVRHLVASHHGWCRPLPPPVVDTANLVVTHTFGGHQLQGESSHGLERLDSGVPDRFWLLVRRYGWHRLAWFEAILRLADHRRSEWEQLHPSGHGEADHGEARDEMAVGSTEHGAP